MNKSTQKRQPVPVDWDQRIKRKNPQSPLYTCLIFLLLFSLTTVLFARGGREKTSPPPTVQVQETIQVSGRIRLVGSGLFPDLVITAPGGEWYIEKDEEYKLKDLQQRTVTVEGNETIKTLSFANGQSAGERRILSNIKIILVE